MKKEKNKLSLKEKATMKLLNPIVEKLLNETYNILIFYCNDEMIYYDAETNKPTIDAPEKEDYINLILNNLKGDNKTC